MPPVNELLKLSLVDLTQTLRERKASALELMCWRF